jgi:outer membrane autotransporter protein
VNGNVALAGSNLHLHFNPGEFGPATSQIIIDNKGGSPVDGTFASVTDDVLFLDAFVTYNAGNGNDVSVRLLRNDVDFCFVTVTANQCSVVRALEEFPLDNTLLLAMVTQTAAGARQAADALSGEVHASVQTTLLDDSRFVRQAVLGRLRQMPYNGEAGAMAALAGGGPNLAYFRGLADPEVNSTGLAYASSAEPAFPAKAMALKASPAPSDLVFWAQGIGAWGKVRSDGNAADASRTFGGVVGGLDFGFGNLRAGLVTGYSQANVKIDDRTSSAKVETGYAGAYAGTSVGAWSLRAGAVYAFHDIGTSRAIAFPGFNDQTSANYRGGTGQVFGEVGYGLLRGAIAAEPFAGLTWAHLDTGRFTEAGGAAALSGAGNTESVGFSSLGMRLATNYMLQNGMILTPRVSLAWQHSFSGIPPAAVLAFASTGPAFTIAGVPLARDSALVDAGVALRINPNARIGMSYSGQFSSTVYNHAAKGSLTWNF